MKFLSPPVATGIFLVLIMFGLKWMPSLAPNAVFQDVVSLQPDRYLCRTMVRRCLVTKADRSIYLY